MTTATLRKDSIELQLAYSSEAQPIVIMVGSMAAHRQSWCCGGVESSSRSAGSRKKKMTLAWLEQPQSLPPVTPFVQSNKATLTQTGLRLLIVPLTMSLWLSFLFKPPASTCPLASTGQNHATRGSLNGVNFQRTREKLLK